MGIRLAGGKAYYMQAVGAQSGGRDCLSVGVQFPTGVVLRPITRHFLTRAPVGELTFHKLLSRLIYKVFLSKLDGFYQKNYFSNPPYPPR